MDKVPLKPENETNGKAGASHVTALQLGCVLLDRVFDAFEEIATPRENATFANIASIKSAKRRERWERWLDDDGRRAA